MKPRKSRTSRKRTDLASASDRSARNLSKGGLVKGDGSYVASRKQKIGKEEVLTRPKRVGKRGRFILTAMLKGLPRSMRKSRDLPCTGGRAPFR